MSQGTRKRRKEFLNALCAKFGIENSSDPRRSNAAIVFIAYGEAQCRTWLAQAEGEYASWARLVDLKQARRVVSKTAQRKKGSSIDKRRRVSKRMIVGEGGAVTTWERLSLREERRLLNRI